jgi:hypothetical protein
MILKKGSAISVAVLVNEATYGTIATMNPL